MAFSDRMPVLFIGHGSPMNAIENNKFGRTWEDLGRSLPVPKAILCISAHWETRGTYLTAMPQPRTIHDFSGFPEELYRIQYPARGSEELIDLLKENVKSIEVQNDLDWGLDHGAWSVLCRMYPKADIPVVQLSLNREQAVDFHFALGRELSSLRDEGILILGSGNFVHNLGLLSWSNQQFDWAVEYDALIKGWIRAGEYDQVVHYERHGKAAALSVNSGEHYLPLLYVLGASQAGEAVAFYNEDVIMGSISMCCIQLG